MGRRSCLTPTRHPKSAGANGWLGRGRNFRLARAGRSRGPCARSWTCLQHRALKRRYPRGTAWTAPMSSSLSLAAGNIGTGVYGAAMRAAGWLSPETQSLSSSEGFILMCIAYFQTDHARRAGPFSVRRSAATRSAICVALALSRW
ncbi:hypothetical protein CHELA20_11108 [Hyphomicrobiales bacterium]|nr:hypothetical protein CHELA20_11108 [Hyphomicrobiales bacterium]CAH1694918.1 hypothetical protein CHELA41_51339 [Hyphomicrobiales bacterium]